MTTESLDNKIISILDALQNGVVEIGNQTIKYAPDIMDAALKVTQVNALQELIQLIPVIIVLLATIAPLKKLYDWSKAKIKEDSWYGPEAILPIGFLGISWVSAAFVFLGTITNVWTWIGIFEPKLFIAHQIVEKVLK